MYIRNDSIIAYLFWIYGLFSVSSLNICEVGSVQFQLNTIPTIIKQLYWCSVQLYGNFLIRHLSAASMREQQYSSKMRPIGLIHQHCIKKVSLYNAALGSLLVK